MIVTIDGPAGAGKSSVARALAQRLRFRFLDTGAMYRAVALAAMRRGLAWDEPDALAELARRVELTWDDERILLDGDDVSEAIRSSEVTAATHYAANNAGVRTELVRMQRAAVGNDDVVAEGRDQGTVAFPQAECKIFLTASPAERARRRLQELQARGESPSFDELLAQQNARDASDSTRAVGPLIAAEDAVHVVTDGLDLEQVVARLEEVVRSKMGESPV